jgi:hypothetical protein
MQKAGLEADIARLERLRFAHQDDQFAIRRQLRDAERDIEYSTRRIGELGKDLDAPRSDCRRRLPHARRRQGFAERKLAGRALMKEILTLVQLQQKARRRHRLASADSTSHIPASASARTAIATPPCWCAPEPSTEIELPSPPRRSARSPGSSMSLPASTSSKEQERYRPSPHLMSAERRLVVLSFARGRGVYPVLC